MTNSILAAGLVLAEQGHEALVTEAGELLLAEDQLEGTAHGAVGLPSAGRAVEDDVARVAWRRRRLVRLRFGLARSWLSQESLELGLRELDDRSLPAVLLDWARRDVVPRDLELVREVLALDRVLARLEQIARGNGADSEHRVLALVCDDPVAGTDVPEGPDLRHPLAVLVVLGALRGTLVELGLRRLGQVAELRPADRDDAPLLPLGPRDRVLAGRDLPVPRPRGPFRWLRCRQVAPDLLAFGSRQLSDLGSRVDEQTGGEVDRHLVPLEVPGLGVGQRAERPDIAFDEKGQLVALGHFGAGEEIVEEGVDVLGLDRRLLDQRLERCRVLNRPRERDRPRARLAVTLLVVGLPDGTPDLEHVPERSVPLHERLVHDVIRSAAEPRPRIDCPVGREEHLLLVDRTHHRLRAVLIEEGDLPLQHRREVDFFDPGEVVLLDRVENLDESTSDGGKSLLLGGTEPRQPGVLLTPDSTAGRLLRFRLVPAVDPELERRPAPDATQGVEARLESSR